MNNAAANATRVRQARNVVRMNDDVKDAQEAYNLNPTTDALEDWLTATEILIGYVNTVTMQVSEARTVLGLPGE